MGLMKEFREFALKGSFIDMAVGIITGAAVGKVVSSLVNDVIMPPIGMLLGKVDFKDLAVVLKPRVMSPDGASILDPGVYVRYGLFLNNLFEFTITAFCIFMMLKFINRARQALDQVGHVKEIVHDLGKKLSDPR